MNKKYTPAPWFQSHRPIPHDKDGMYATQVYTEDGETIATLAWYAMPKDENGRIGTYREANAKLIAAAPELLEALEYFVKCHSKEYMKCEIPDAIEKAKKAIKKATI